jgi:hypothetical protein
VIADAVYARQEERDAIAAVAREQGVPFLGLWLDAAEMVLSKRLRERTGDVSDATSVILEAQLESGAGSVDWHRVDASLNLETVQKRAEELLRAP